MNKYSFKKLILLKNANYLLIKPIQIIYLPHTSLYMTSWLKLCQSKKVEYHTTIYNSVNDIHPDSWNKIVNNQNIYLSIPYLKAIEESLSEQMEFKYFVFTYQSNPVAIAYIQIVDFANEGLMKNKVFCSVADKIKNKILESIDAKMMICGNVFACGENGFIYSKEIKHEDAYHSLSNALYNLRESEKSKKPISVVLLKEFWPISYNTSDNYKKVGFKDFKVDVNMVLKIHSDWKSMDDYLASMITKFRTKAKSAYKKSAMLKIKELSLEETQTHQAEIAQLYTNVVERAEFKFGVLNADAFISLKANLGDKFIIKGYFLNSIMIGFSTSIIDNNILDANFVGINYEHNYEYAVYQRMLYDFVDIAIQNKCIELRLGRTAEEIKSCIGAEPVDMKLYLRLRNSVSNHLLAPIISSITPSEFELRSPFKVEFMKSTVS